MDKKELMELEAPPAPDALTAIYLLDDTRFEYFRRIFESAEWKDENRELIDDDPAYMEAERQSWLSGEGDYNQDRDSFFDQQDVDRGSLGVDIDDEGYSITEMEDSYRNQEGLDDEYIGHTDSVYEQGWGDDAGYGIDRSQWSDKKDYSDQSKKAYTQEIEDYLSRINDSNKKLFYKKKPVDDVANASYLFLDEYFDHAKTVGFSEFINIIYESKSDYSKRLDFFNKYHLGDYDLYIGWLEAVIEKVQEESYQSVPSASYKEPLVGEYEEELVEEELAEEEFLEDSEDETSLEGGIPDESEEQSVFDSSQISIIDSLISDYINDLELYQVYKAELLKFKAIIDDLDDPSGDKISQEVVTNLIRNRSVSIAIRQSVGKTILSGFGPERFFRMSEEDILSNIESRLSYARSLSFDNKEDTSNEIGDLYEEAYESIGDSIEEDADEAWDGDPNEASKVVSENVRLRFDDLVSRMASDPEPIISKDEILSISSDSYFSSLILDDNSEYIVKEILVPAISSFVSIIKEEYSNASDKDIIGLAVTNIVVKPYDRSIPLEIRAFILNIITKYLGDKAVSAEPSDLAEKISLIYQYFLFEKNTIGEQQVASKPSGLDYYEVSEDGDLGNYEIVDYEGYRGVEGGKLARNLGGSLRLILSNGPGDSQYLRLIKDAQAAGDLPKNSTLRQMEASLRPRGLSLDIGGYYFNDLFYSIDKLFNSTSIADVNKDILADIKNNSANISTFLTYKEEEGAVANRQTFDQFMIGCTTSLRGFIGKFYDPNGDKGEVISEINTLISAMKIVEENNVKILQSNMGLTRREAISYLFDNNISISKSVTSGHLLRTGVLEEQLKTKSPFVRQLFFFISAVLKNEEFFALRGKGASEKSDSVFANEILEGIVEIAPEYTEKETVIEDFITKVIRAQVSKIDQLFRINEQEGSDFDINGDRSNWDGKSYDDTHANRIVKWENDIGKMVIDIKIMKSNYKSFLRNIPGYRKIKCPMCAKEKPVRADLRGQRKLGRLLKANPSDMDLFLDPFSYTAYSPYKDDGSIVSEEDLSRGSTKWVVSPNGKWAPPENLKQAKNKYYDIDDQSNWRTWSEIIDMTNSPNKDVSIDGLKRKKHAEYIASSSRERVGEDEAKLWPPPQEYARKIVSMIQYDYKDTDNWMTWDDINDLIGSNNELMHEEGLLRRAEVYKQIGCSEIKSGAAKSSDILARNHMFKCPFDDPSDKCGLSFEPQGSESESPPLLSMRDMSISLNPAARNFDTESVMYKIPLITKEYSVLDYDSFDSFAKEVGMKESDIKSLNPGLTDIDIFGIKDYIIGHESLESIVSSKIGGGKSRNGLSVEDELIKIKNYGENKAIFSMSDKDFLSGVAKSTSSPELIQSLAIDNDDLEYGVISSGTITLSNNIIDSDDYWSSEVRDKDSYDRFLNLKTSGGYKFSSTFFPCPCHIHSPDLSMADKYTVMAVPHAGPVGLWNLNDEPEKVFYHPPTTPDGRSKFDDIEFGQTAYLICGAPTSISRFSRDMDPSNKNTMMSILKEHGKSVCDTLIREYGVDIEDLRPILTYLESQKSIDNDLDIDSELIDDDLEKMSNFYKSDRMSKITSLFSSAMAKVVSRDGFSDKIANLELVCPYGHKFTIKQSWDFGRSHFAYHLQKRSMSLADKSNPESEKIMRSSLEKFLPLLQSTGLDNLKIAMDDTSLFKNIGGAAYNSSGELLKKYSAFYDYIYSPDDSVRGSILSDQWIESSKKKDYNILHKDFKSSFLISIPDMQEDELRARLSTFIDDLDDDDWRIDLIQGLSGNHTFGTTGTKSSFGKFSSYLIQDKRTYDVDSARIDFEPIKGLQHYISSESLDSLGVSSDGEGRSFEETIDEGVEFLTGTIREFDFVAPDSGKLGDQSLQRQFLSKMASGDSSIDPRNSESFDENEFYKEAVKGVGLSTDQNLGIIPDQFNSFISALKMYIRLINLYYKKSQEETVTSFLTGTVEQRNILSGEGSFSKYKRGIPEPKTLQPHINNLIDSLIDRGFILKTDDVSVSNISRFISEDIYERLSEPNPQDTSLDLNYPELDLPSESGSGEIIRTSSTNLIADMMTLNIINIMKRNNLGISPGSIKRSSALKGIEDKYQYFKEALSEDFIEIESDDSISESPELIRDLFVDLFLNMLDLKKSNKTAETPADSAVDTYDLVIDIINEYFNDQLPSATIDAVSRDIDKIINNIVLEIDRSGAFSKKVSFLKLSTPIKRFISSDPGWIRSLAPTNRLNISSNDFLVRTDTKANTSGGSKVKRVSTTSWNPRVGTFMLQQEDLRHIVGAKIHMAYCLYLIDCLDPIVNIYLRPDSIKYIGYELEVLDILKDPELICDISEDSLDTMIDDFDELNDQEKDQIVSECIKYIKSNMITGMGHSIVTPFSEAYIYLGELMSNPRPIVNNSYMQKASEIIKNKIKQASLGEDSEYKDSFFENPMYEYFFERSTVFKTDELLDRTSLDLAPYPCIYRDGGDSHTVRDIKNFGLNPRGRVSVISYSDNPKDKAVVSDPITGYDSSKVQWGKIGPTRYHEGRYPPPDGFDVFGGETKILTSRGKVLDLYDDHSKSSEYQNKKIGLSTLVVPKASINIEVNGKIYDISFLVRRADHEGIMKLRRRISFLSEEKSNCIRAIESYERYGEEESAMLGKRMLSKIEDSMSSLYNRIPNYSIDVSTSLMNKVAILAKNYGSVEGPSDDTYKLKSLPCITEVDFYTAYWLITNPESAPHPYTSEEDQSNLLVYLFESANLSPILNSLEKSGIIGSTTLSDLRPGVFYDIDSIANFAILSKIKNKYNNPGLFSIKSIAPGDKIIIEVYEDGSGEIGHSSESIPSVDSFSIDSKIRVHDGKSELVAKIHKMFREDTIEKVNESFSTIVGKDAIDMVRFQGDYVNSDNATFGRYFDIKSSDDAHKSSITYSMASLSIDDLLAELDSFRRDLGIKRGAKASVGDMKRIQELLVLLTPSILSEVKDSYRDSLKDIELRLKDVSEKLSIDEESVNTLTEERNSLRKNRKALVDSFKKERLDSIKDEIREIDVRLREVSSRRSSIKDDAIPKHRAKKSSLEAQRKARSAILEGNRFGGVWPGTWKSGPIIGGSRSKRDRARELGDSSILFNAARDIIFNTKFLMPTKDEESTLFDYYRESNDDFSNIDITRSIDPFFEVKHWKDMLEMLCKVFNVDSNARVSKNYYTRISDVFDSTKSSESMRVYVNKIVSNTHAIWSSQVSSERAAALALKGAVLPSNPYFVFNDVARYLADRDSDGGVSTYIPSFDKNTPFEKIKTFYRSFIGALGFDRPGASDEDKEMDKRLKAAFGAIEAQRINSNAKFIGSIRKRSVREDIFWRIINAS